LTARPVNEPLVAYEGALRMLKKKIRALELWQRRQTRRLRMAFDPHMNSLIELASQYSKTPNEALARQIIMKLVKSNNLIQVARWIVRLRDLSGFSSRFLMELHASFPTPFLVLGGGADFLYPLWQNLDPNTGPLNPFAFNFDPQHVLPASPASREIVYTYRALDLSGEDSCNRICSEAARVLNNEGALILSASKIDTVGLTELAERCGMDVLSTDRDRIISRFDYVPRIAVDAENRYFVLAVRRQELAGNSKTHFSQ
jgi:hypothetical protein